MKVGKFTEEQNPNGGTSVFYSGVFVGRYSNILHPIIEQFTGNKKQNNSMNLLLRYMRAKHPNEQINYIEQTASQQKFLVAACGHIILQEGVVKSLKPYKS